MANQTKVLMRSHTGIGQSLEGAKLDNTAPAEQTTDGTTANITPLNTSSPLLKMPAELREIIYRAVLVSNCRIPIVRNTSNQPALTRVCRQIRAESLGIFYLETQFLLHMHNFDASALLYWRKAPIAHSYRKLRIELHSSLCIRSPDEQAQCITNLMKWLEEVYKTGVDSALRPKGQGERHADDAYFFGFRAQKLFDIADMLRASGMGWEAAKPILETARDGMCILRKVTDLA